MTLFQAQAGGTRTVKSPRVIPLVPKAVSWLGTVDCRNCGIRGMVLFSDLTEQDFDLIHAPIDDLALAASVSLYAEGDLAGFVFTLKRGAVKLVRHTSDGRVRIVRVLRPGDVIGLEAVVTGRYDSEAITLSASSVCRIPLSVIHRLDERSPGLRRRLMEKWQRALREAICLRKNKVRAPGPSFQNRHR